MPKEPVSILCVDDEPDILAALARDLRHDFTVHTALSIEEADRKLASGFEEALILCDFQIGEDDGLEWLKNAQKVQPDCARVLLTGRLDWDKFSLALDTGVIQRLVTKPWDSVSLRLQMKEALQSYRLLRENRKLAAIAMTDVITEVANHRHFLQSLEIEFQRANRHDRTLALAMVDIDNFKHFNDEHGHPAGDQVLREIAACLRISVRTIDLVARYGGDEFAILMPDTTMALGRAACDRAREEVLISTRATISLGLADSTGRKSAADLVAAADRALYGAKAAGRNQVVAARD